MNSWKRLGCLIGLVATTMLSTSAFAGPITLNVTNVQVNWGQGQGLTIMEGPNPASIYYAGPIYFTVNGINGPIIVWCDDLYNDVYIGSSNTYCSTVSPANYLSPLSSTTIHNIAGLQPIKERRKLLANTLTSARGAEFQLAIWEQIYGNISDIADVGIQSGVDSLIASAPNFFADMNASGWTYDELASPGCGQQPDAITYQNGCQTQGQIYVHPNNGSPFPSPPRWRFCWRECWWHFSEMLRLRLQGLSGAEAHFFSGDHTVTRATLVSPV